MWKLNQKGSIFEKTDLLPQISLEISDLTGWLFGYQSLKNPLDEEVFEKLKHIDLFERFFVNDEV